VSSSHGSTTPNTILHIYLCMSNNIMSLSLSLYYNLHIQQYLNKFGVAQPSNSFDMVFQVNNELSCLFV